MMAFLVALAPAIAIVNVNLIRIDRERVEPAQTVIVRGDRIAAIGPSAGVPVPPDATVIDGAGRYLVPGLTDAHVHLTTDMSWAPARPDFGDAPLYLAYGVTTVINLGGSRAQLEWRRRVNAGQLPGPTIYTSGEFINEPRVNTPEEVKDEVAAQHRAGYDLIKFHEIFTPGAGYTTTRGLSLAAYRTMNETARQLGLPLVGHAPVNLGLDALLDAHQPLAHMGMLSNIYFLPLVANRMWLVSTAAALAALTLAIVASGIAARSRLRLAAGLIWAGDVLAVLCAALFLPGGPLFESLALRIAFTALAIVTAAGAAGLAMSTVALWRARSVSQGTRVHAAAASIAGLAFSCAVLVFWLPVAWRSSDWGIERLAKRIQNAGIPVQTTLVVYDAMGGPGRLRLINGSAIQYLRSDTQALWRAGAQATDGPAAYAGFMKKVAGGLHRAGVPLIAGTDAMGLPLVAPGSSLHRELELLTESGLTPYEAIGAATIAPAVFLGKENEFGSIAVGKRADLLLVEGNPLQGVSHLTEIAGVMVRGAWFSSEQLRQMLAALKN